MWHPEARDSSPIIFTFMSSWWERTKLLLLPWRRGTRRSLWVDELELEPWVDELELEPWVSLWSNHFGEESTPPLAWRSNGAEKFTAVEDFAPYSVEAVQDAAAAGKEGDKSCRRREGGEQGVAGRENPLRWRISRRYSLGCCRGGQGVTESQNPLRRGMSFCYWEKAPEKS
jgi:hypothetical protein